MQTLTFDQATIEKLARRVAKQGPVFSFQDDPALAALCTCLGLQFELGRPDYDRLTPYLSFASGDWESRIFVMHSEIGISFWRKDGRELIPRHPDLVKILDPMSLDENGRMKRAVVFPLRVAKQFSQLGFNLVIVRDWILRSALAAGDEGRVGYLISNEWEISTNIAKRQIGLMSQCQIPFFGTHDVVDHLLGADKIAYKRSSLLVQHLSTFYEQEMQTPQVLKMSYLIAVLLDDLAQPCWYGSERHTRTIMLAKRWIEKNASMQKMQDTLALPETFHQLVTTVRDKDALLEAISDAFLTFSLSLHVEADFGEPIASPTPSSFGAVHRLSSN